MEAANTGRDASKTDAHTHTYRQIHIDILTDTHTVIHIKPIELRLDGWFSTFIPPIHVHNHTTHI